MKSSFYSEEEISLLGFKSVGINVLISRYARFYTPETIQIGNNVRIDDFCILSGNIEIGSNIHISAFVAIYGKYGVVLEDYSGISPRSTIFSAVDDFSGNYLIGPIHDTNSIHVTGGMVRLCRYSQLGTNVVVFPDVIIGEGCVVGACSLVRKALEPWGIYWGIPVCRHSVRSKKMLDFIRKNGD